MVYALVLHLDAATDEAVRLVWDRLAEEGIAKAPAQIHVPPHVTIWVSDDLERKAAPPVIDRFAERLQPIEVRFRSVGAFPTRWGPVFYAPVPTTALLDLHRDAFTLAMDIGAYPQWHQRPAHWVPHLTASLELEEGKVAEAVRICTEMEMPEKSQFNSLGLWRTHPDIESIHRVLFEEATRLL